MNFTLGGVPEADLRGASTKEDTPVGRVIIITYGYQFHWDDLIYFFRDNARDNFIYFIPIAAAAAVIAWLATRRGLLPLLEAAASASRIDMNSIGQRIPLEGIPAETMPLVEAVNAALARLDAGAASQRRFAANAAHELTTPIAILHTRIDALADAPYKTDLKRDVRRIQTIVEQLLTAASDIEGTKSALCENDGMWTKILPPDFVTRYGCQFELSQPIFVAAVIGVEKLLRINLDPTQGPVSYVRQVLDRLPEEVPAFGKTIGFVINYSPDQAVRFDPNGQPIAILDKAVRPWTAVLLRLGGRPIPAEALGLIIGK